MPAIQRDIKSIFGEVLELASTYERSRYLDTVCANDPSLRAEIEQLLDAYHQAGDFLVHVAGHATVSEPLERLGTIVGKYKLQELIGEGGMGVVYLAEQQEPFKRQVALKIIKPGMDSRQVISRFEAERQALALMEHPNIARVLDAGATDSGLPYFVMELVRGLTITEYCDQARLELRRRLELLVAVCQAVQHAHQKGIIHRDLKPSNVMVTLRDGTPIVKVIDFGVSKAIDRRLTERTVQTAHAQLLGTPLYMSPEQAQLSGQDVDTRTDVYSLGVLLYELLTGTTPFDKERLQNASFDEMRRIIREEEPDTVSTRLAKTASARAPGAPAHRKSKTHNPKSFAELDWIVIKALEKDRERRYASASDFATDIERYLGNLPVLARPSPWWLRLRKWCRRHPIGTALSAAAALFLVILAAGVYWHDQRLAASLAVTERLYQQGLVREEVLRQELFSNDMQRASFLHSAGRLAEARQVLERHRPQPGHKDSRLLAWSYLWTLVRQQEPLHVLRGHGADILTADVSPAGKLVASADRGGEVRIWDVARGADLHALHYSDQEVTCVRFSPDGHQLATAGQDRTIRLWDVSTWSESKKLEKHEKTITCVAWSPDSTRLVSSGRDNSVHIWDCGSGRSVSTLPEHTDVVRCLAWSPDGKCIATADINRGVLVWDASSGMLRGSLPIKSPIGDSEGVLAIDFSGDSQLIAYGGYGGLIRIAQVADLSEVASVSGSVVLSLAFATPEVLVVGAGNGYRMLSISRRHGTAQWLTGAFAETGPVTAALPVHDGKLLITAAQKQRSISVWRTESLFGYRQTQFDQQPVALSPEGDLLASAPGKEHVLNIQTAADRKLLTSIRYLRRDGCLAVFSQEGDLLAAPLPIAALPVQIWNTRAWKPIRRLPYSGMPPTKLDFSFDKQWLAAAGHQCVVGCWHIESGAWHEVLPPDSTVVGEPWQTAISFSPTENLLAAARWNDEYITLWQPGRGVVRRLPATNTHAIAFSHRGQIMAAESEEVICLWEVASGKLLGKLLFEDEAKRLDVSYLAFSPDSNTLAGAATDSTLRLWDLSSHRLLLAARLPSMPLWLQFLPSGQLTVGCESGSVAYFQLFGED